MKVLLERAENCGCLEIFSLSKAILALEEVSCDGTKKKCTAVESVRVFPRPTATLTKRHHSTV